MKNRIALIVEVMLTLVLLAGHARAADPAAPVSWEGPDIAGKVVYVPAKGQPAVLVFIKNQQSRSSDITAQVKTLLTGKPVTVLAVVSGKDAAAQAKAFSEQAQWAWPIVADPDYAVSGKMAVRVWPTTLVVRDDGVITGHLAGSSNSFAKDLESHVDFAARKIDEQQLAAQVASHDVVAGKAEHAAARHQRVAMRLLERHQVEAAHEELQKSLAEMPDDPTLIELMARTQLLMGKPQEALNWLKKLDEKSAGATKVLTIRGRALLALGQRDAAVETLNAALKLNPDPAEAHYALGTALQESNPAKAAEHFRAAFEATDEARRIGAQQK